MLLGTQKVNELGRLEIGGCDTVQLAKEFGTPLYVMDESAIRTAIRSYRAAFEASYPHNEICYASKAFLTIAMACLIDQEGLSMDVASLGELYTVLKAGFPAERISLHGNNKSREELELALSAGIGLIILDNFYELEILQSLIVDRNCDTGVLVRATPGVDPKTHRLIRTGQADTKFGFNIADGSAMKAIRSVLATPRLLFRGIHCHVGSQLLETETHVVAVQVMVKLLQTIVEETGAVVDILNIGGGLGVRYLENQKAPTYMEFAKAVTDPLKSALDQSGMPYPILQQEPGRSLVGEAGVTLYTVGAMKTVPISESGGTRTYVSVDGGLSDNPRPQMYQARYECILANRIEEKPDTLVTIAGKHCETDILLEDVTIPSPEPGDILAVQTTGAYNFAMSSNYNRFLKPAVALVNEGDAELIVERQSLEDLIRYERIPKRLQKIEPSRSSE